jgi:hypothetical protein
MIFPIADWVDFEFDLFAPTNLTLECAKEFPQ